MSLVEVQEQNGVVTLSLTDPATRNAMSELMAGEFESVVLGLCKRRDIRVVVLRGAGEVFSGGGNLDMLFEKTKISREENKLRMQAFYQSFLSVLEIPVPVIAAINGHAMGAGLCLTLACDFRVVRSGARLGLNFVHLGLHPGMAATYFLPRLVGSARARELLFTGRVLTAEYAAEIGLVNHVVSESSFDVFVQEKANMIASAGPQAVRELKATLRDMEGRSLSDCLLRESECQALDFAGREFLEGINAAREKRPAKFR